MRKTDEETEPPRAIDRDRPRASASEQSARAIDSIRAGAEPRRRPPTRCPTPNPIPTPTLTPDSDSDPIAIPELGARSLAISSPRKARAWVVRHHPRAPASHRTACSRCS